MAQMIHAQGFDIFTFNGDLLTGPVSVAANAVSANVLYTLIFAEFDLLGSGFDVPFDKPSKADGTVETVLFSLDGMNVSFSLDGIEADLGKVIKALEKGKPDKLVKTFFAGDDIFFGSGGNDGFDGQKGEDTVVYQGLFADFVIEQEKKTVTVFDLNADDGSEGVDRMEGIEFIRFADVLYNVDEETVSPLGTEGNDTLTGDGDDNEILGLGGDDIINGGGGNDLLDGGAGRDTLDGGAGKDTLIGGDGDDVFFVTKGDKVIETETGGIDGIVSAESIKLGDTVENAVLIGSESEKIRGNDGANTLTGNAGDNKIQGRDGADILDGGDGEDLLDGGDGADTFVFAALGTGDRDTIKDFEDGVDAIDVSALGIADFEMLSALLTSDGKDTLLTAANGAVLEIAKTELGLLDAGDFVFASLV